MKTSETQPLGQAGNPPETDFYTLDCYHTGAPKPLFTQPADAITKIHLEKLVTDNQSAPYTALTLSATDPNHSPQIPGTLTEPVPRGSRIRQATYKFTVRGSHKPSTADVFPPNTLKVHPSRHTEIFHRYLQTIAICTNQKAAQILAILLALFTGLNPNLDADPIGDGPCHAVFSFTT